MAPPTGPEREVLAERARVQWCPGFVAELARRMETADRAELLLARAGIEVEWPADRGGPLGPLLYRAFQHRVHRPEVMRRLFDALEGEYGEQPWVTGLRHGYDALPDGAPAPLPAVAPGMLDAGERRDLDALLDDPRCPTDPDQLCEVLWAAASSLGVLVAKDGLLAAERARSVTALVDDLDARNSPDTRVPPLLVFLEHLAARAEDPVRDELRAWIDAVAHRRPGRMPAAGLTAERGAATLAAGAPAPPCTSCLVRAERCDPGGDRYRLAAWLYRGGRCLGVKLQDDTPHPAEAIPAAAEELIARLQPFVQHLDPESLLFEFLLPWEALGWPVDEWNLRGGGELAVPRPIGRYGPVVVRSLDRLRDGWSTAQWLARWELLGDPPAGQGPPPGPHWLHGDGSPPEETEPAGPADDVPDPEREPLIADASALQALAGRLASRKNISCLFLTYPYPRLTAVPDALLCAIQEGVPAAVWWRPGRNGAAPPGRARRVAELVVADRGLAGLPGTVLGLRRQAAQCPEETHDGNGIAVLWDDPGWHPERLRRLGGPRARQGGM
ncbi:hypothetical protein [Streptomyces sp. NPDC019937]|uniref:VMAP-C domain-containing protein n=1 Tax=Streptomyces sp. NPDC019937 TaxID=3154787 RepID=UPI00340131B3